VDKLLVPLLVGLLAGAGGVFVGKAFTSSASAPAATADTGALEARIAALEEALAKQTPGAALLEGDTRPARTQRSLAVGGASPKLSDEELEALAKQLEPSMRAAAKQEIDERVGKDGGIEALIAEEAKKKKATLAEVARELDLTADQEAEIRQLARASTDEFLKVLAGEDETIEDVRRAFEDAKGDLSKQAELAGKYVARLMSNLGPVMTAVMKYETGMTKILGPEKKDKFENGYDVTDLDPLGIETVFEDMFGN
jgi:hypothetical protein